MPLVGKEALQTLGLAPASRRLPNLTGYTTDLNPEGLRQTPVDYLDYTVDGHPLYGLIAHQLGDIDLVSPLQEHWPELAIDAIPRLLGEASLYVCPECASLGCGAITADIAFTADMVTWRHLGTQDENNERVEPLTIPGTPEMHFAREPYADLLTRELARYQQLLQDAKAERTHQRRASRRRRLRSLVRLFGRT